MLCSVSGCNSEVYVNGMCSKHNARFKRLGSTELPERMCSVEGCTSTVHAHGMCDVHYARFKRLGTTELPERIKTEVPCSVEGCIEMAHTRGMCRNHYRSFRTSEIRSEKLQRRKKAICIIPGCSSPVANKGMCTKHYQRSLKYDVLSLRSIKCDFSLKERFLFYCSENKYTGCVEWLGLKDRDGYGYLSIQGANKRAHRLSFELFKGYIPENTQICHTCDNPSCVNPEHLFLGTNKDNCADKVLKGRQARGSKSGMAILHENDVVAIKKRLALGESCTRIGRSFGVSSWVVSRIKHGKNWKHVQISEHTK